MDALSLNEQWKDCLDLSHRKAPELYETNDEVRNTPYALAIRTTLEELGVSAVFCVEKVPTAVICILEKYDHDGIVELHAKLWNQGLAILLLVLTEDDNTVRVFSLARIPPQSIGESAFDKRCLVQKLEVVADALELKNIIYGVQSGRLWKEHDKLFKFEERIDQILLDNLSAAHKQLCDVDLPKDEAKTLLIQTMFIAYLEDRGIIGKEYFRKASDAKFNNFISLLESKCIFSFEKLFKSLKKDFNGDLFVAPCSFEIDHTSSELRSDYLEILADFRSGELNMSSGQYRFWGYDFKYIPIDLISAVYDRFLGENEKSRKEQGAYYTPMFLANIVISQVWDTHGVQAFDSRSRFLDPACGSGIFLVQCFHRLCEDWIQKHTPTIDWNNLVAILQRLCGWDLNGDAVRVAVFSLYVAFLEYVSSQDIQKFAQKGRSLPGLWSQTLCVKDYFDVPPENFQVDVIVGNPPWVSRKGANHSSVKWCEDQNLPIPDKQSAWGFVWKSLIHLSGKGIVAFLVPSMGFLHNTSNTSVDARQKLTTHA
ncbi:MAG: N-6 DNA methylase, partial [Aestuariivita sp.]|nr:N-6 DNA methylase [Aestuariivita sp.]